MKPKPFLLSNHFTLRLAIFAPDFQGILQMKTPLPRGRATRSILETADAQALRSINNHYVRVKRKFYCVPVKSSATAGEITEKLRQIRRAHQVAVALARRAAAFVERPHDEALAAATI